MAFARGFGILFLLVLWPVASLAQGLTPLDRMMEALRITDTIDVMREEGRRYGADLASEMLPGADAESWDATVMRIHDVGRMKRLVRQGFEKSLTTAEMAEISAYYTTAPGAKILALEISARRAFLDPGIEKQARARHVAAQDADARLRDQVDRMMAESDLIARNVAGSMNSTMMFYRGMMDSGELDMSLDDMLAELWGQEKAFREDAQSWLGGFLMMAYDPLPPEDMEGYLAFWQSEAGRALNVALFTAFDRMYEELSYLTGQAVAHHMQSEKL
jgi:hypothetical protein